MQHQLVADILQQVFAIAPNDHSGSLGAVGHFDDYRAKLEPHLRRTPSVLSI